MTTNVSFITTDFKATKERQKMAKTKTVSNFTPPEKEELARALVLANTLHTTLDIDKLFEVFHNEIQNHMEYSGLNYKNADLAYQTMIGKKGRHSCSYRLLMAGQSLGEVSFSRSAKFSEQETIQLEYLISSLLNPLRNAVMYQHALNTATRDPLTGANNRASYENDIKREISLAQRHETPLSMIVLDIDHFKNINDQHGHLVGDCVLRDVAHAIQNIIRSSDMLFRYGGEEFVILLSNTNPEGARYLAERIRRGIEKKTCKFGKISVRVTASLGVATLASKENAKQLFKRTDDALYQAKKNGRNLCVFAE